jgi:hypothetical protein
VRPGPSTFGAVAVAIAVALAVVLSSCAGPEPAPSGPDLLYGTPIEAGPKPDPGRCQQLIRAEIGTAIRTRAELMTPGVATDEVAVRAAAEDPTADIHALGIPLTAMELRALKGNGMGMDAGTPIAFWVNVGARERFGGIWLRGGATNVAVVRGDPATLALARCIEPADAAYVWAGVSKAEGEALLSRVASDMDRWRADGIAINQIDYDETAGVVTVGVSEPTQQALDALQAAYGSLIRVVKQDPGIPL